MNGGRGTRPLNGLVRGLLFHGDFEPITPPIRNAVSIRAISLHSLIITYPAVGPRPYPGSE